MKHIKDDKIYCFPVELEAEEKVTKEIIFGGVHWKTIGLTESGNEGITMRFTKDKPEGYAQETIRLRMTISDNVRGETIVRAILPRSGIVIGNFDIRYGCRMQIFEIPISPSEVKEALEHGIQLVAEEGAAVRIIQQTAEGENTIFSPHLMTGDLEPSMSMFLQHLTGSTSFHPSGWMEGCVLEGMYELHGLTGNPEVMLALRQHLEAYFEHEGTKEEQHKGPRVVNGRILADVIEKTLPMAVLARLDIDNPKISAIVDYWQGYAQSDGAILDQETRTITTEGNFTVAYPMAVIAEKQQNESLAILALQQLYSRRNSLTETDAIYLRCNLDTGDFTYRNWNRGCAWYMLGWIKTLASLYQVLPAEKLIEAENEFKRVAELAAKYQDHSGLWFNFWDHMDSGLETSGSAGIATALAMGSRLGLLNASYRERAHKTWNALQASLTPDGLLTGIAQTNQGGEELQMSGYRVIFSAGMGLMAQLGAELGEFNE